MRITLLAVTVAWVVMCAMNTAAQDRAQVIKSFYSKSDFPLSADADASQWKGVEAVTADRGPHGDLTANHRTLIRSRWSDRNLYLLFTCAYEQLYSKPNPSTTMETNKLWEWDVAEVFIGSDFQNIKHYYEFQVSPQGEWVDLDIDRNASPPDHNVQWNSGFEVKARIDQQQRIWYGEMRIPLSAIDRRKPQQGQEYRINFYRFQGPPPDRKRIAWQPTHLDNYHVPEAFGLLRFE